MIIHWIWLIWTCFYCGSLRWCFCIDCWRWSVLHTVTKLHVYEEQHEEDKLMYFIINLTLLIQIHIFIQSFVTCWSSRHATMLTDIFFFILCKFVLPVMILWKTIDNSKDGCFLLQYILCLCFSFYFSDFIFLRCIYYF